MNTSALVRSAIALSAVFVTAACSGTASTSPSPALTSSVSASSASTDAQGGSLTGTAALSFVDTGGGVFGFLAGTQDGQTSRVGQLTGDIEDNNFEPGVCHDGVDTSLGLYCEVFGEGPG